MPVRNQTVRDQRTAEEQSLQPSFEGDERRRRIRWQADHSCGDSEGMVANAEVTALVECVA